MTVLTDVPSPFCGMGTDDLKIHVDGLKLTVKENGCSVNTGAFEQPVTDLKPRISGAECTLNEAVLKAAKLLKNKQLPVFGGCATDVNGMRALLSLADQNGAVVDNMSFNAARRNILTLQDAGWINTTLAEVKNRCDVLLIVGTDLEGVMPRFFDRYIWNKDSMFVKETAERKIIYLGQGPSGKASISPKGKNAQVIKCADHQLPDVIAVLKALLKGHSVTVDTVGGIKLSKLQTVIKLLSSAQYGVVTWAAGALDFSQADLTVQGLCDVVKLLNESTRCSGLPLLGKNGDQTANQVCGWTTGYPARVSFAGGFPHYDPYLYDTNQLFQNGEADLLLWVNAFDTEAQPPACDFPTIVLGRSGMTFNQEPDVFFPVGTPGIDHVGHAYRLDNVVAIRLKKLRDSGLPSAAEVLNAIQIAL
ncbi:MAG: formylmethanofuran dehydrogenase subunit B [Methylococcaceae bacterium]